MQHCAVVGSWSTSPPPCLDILSRGGPHCICCILPGWAGSYSVLFDGQNFGSYRIALVVGCMARLCISIPRYTCSWGASCRARNSPELSGLFLGFQLFLGTLAHEILLSL